MDRELALAKEYLDEEDCTCVLYKSGTLLSSNHRGVRPLLDFLDSGRDLRGFCAADKVVGKATAFLYCLLGVRAVHARVMSLPAVRVLVSFGISVSSDELTDGIRNRAGTGPCPMEQATKDIDDPREALEAIRKTLESLK